MANSSRRTLATAVTALFVGVAGMTAGASQPEGPFARTDAPAASALWDGFEDPGWPDADQWRIAGSTAPTWWPSGCRARRGARSLWAFGGRLAGGAEQPCAAAAPPGTVSTVVQRLDLRAARAASRLELAFDLWLQLPPGDATGVFIFVLVPQPGGQPNRVPVFGATGNASDWVYPARQLDLMNLADITDPREVYDLRGGVWELEWRAHAPNGTAPGAGVFVDDIRLVWEPDAAVPTPTVRPTGSVPTPPPPPTPTPSATPTPTRTATIIATAPPDPRTTTPAATRTATVPPRTATPSRTPAVTAGPPGFQSYLPWAANGEIEATPTATAEKPGRWLYLPWLANGLDVPD